ncbi:MAG TPA: terpene cyclase/mutase family protein [Thermoplasmata archaeon]|nr:terpene cyclase/mutase family protein [Thermoplasmata archaeon]
MQITPEVLEWLLEPSQPAVRFATLVDLLDRGQKDPDVREARAAIPTRGWARDILRSQRPEGHWESREDLYRPKYTATIWRLIVLADLGMTAGDARVRRACERFLSEYAREDGGFDTPGSTWVRSELCLTGNLARTLMRCGFGDDTRVRSAYEWLVDHQMEDGGWHCFYEKAFGRGTLDAWEGLYAYAFLPAARRSPRIRRSIERGAEFFLERELLHQGRRYVPWTRTHYPVHYYYDFLVGLDMLTRLGYGDDARLRPALDLLEKKRRPDGTWALDKVHPDLGAGAGYRFRKQPKRFALETEGRPSKWITLTALQVLKRVEETGGE